MRISADLVPYAGGELIFTDDRAPVELLGMRMIDGIIEEELAYYQDLYKREGLRGVLADFG